MFKFFKTVGYKEFFFRNMNTLSVLIVFGHSGFLHCTFFTLSICGHSIATPRNISFHDDSNLPQCDFLKIHIAVTRKKISDFNVMSIPICLFYAERLRYIVIIHFFSSVFLKCFLSCILSSWIGFLKRFFDPYMRHKLVLQLRVWVDLEVIAMIWMPTNRCCLMS